MAIRAQILTLPMFAVLVMSSTAFVVNPQRSFTITNQGSTTSLQFNFLKNLGLEKPDWLPDFGGSKEKEPAAEEPVDVAAEGEGDEEGEDSE